MSLNRDPVHRKGVSAFDRRCMPTALLMVGFPPYGFAVNLRLITLDRLDYMVPFVGSALDTKLNSFKHVVLP